MDGRGTGFVATPLVHNHPWMSNPHNVYEMFTLPCLGIDVFYMLTMWTLLSMSLICCGNYQFCHVSTRINKILNWKFGVCLQWCSKHCHDTFRERENTVSNNTKMIAWSSLSELKLRLTSFCSSDGILKYEKPILIFQWSSNMCIMVNNYLCLGGRTERCRTEDSWCICST